MAGQLSSALLCTAAPVGTAVAGGLVAAFWPPVPWVRSYIQHFAAGVVFSALAVEVLPDLMHHRSPGAAAGGFAVGAALMLVIRWLSRSRAGRDEAGDAGGGVPWSYVLPIAVDVLIDGLLLGIGFVAGQQTGKLLAIALAAEFLSLGLATAAELVGGGVNRGRSIVTTTGLALLPIGGVVAGVLLLSAIGRRWLEAMLAFAAAALLYLVPKNCWSRHTKSPRRHRRRPCFSSDSWAFSCCTCSSEHPPCVFGRDSIKASFGGFASSQPRGARRGLG